MPEAKIIKRGELPDPHSCKNVITYLEKNTIDRLRLGTIAMCSCGKQYELRTKTPWFLGNYFYAYQMGDCWWVRLWLR